MKSTYEGEMQFAGFSDSSRAGPRITMRLPEREDLDAFIGKEGRRFMAVLVEIGDDELPAAQEDTPPQQQRKPRERMGPLCEWAVMRCAEPQFQRWCFETLPDSFTAPLNGKSLADMARASVLHLCGVTSRKDLDTDGAAKERLHRLVRQPYAEWLKRGGGRLEINREAP